MISRKALEHVCALTNTNTHRLAREAQQTEPGVCDYEPSLTGLWSAGKVSCLLERVCIISKRSCLSRAFAVSLLSREPDKLLACTLLFPALCPHIPPAFTRTRTGDLHRPRQAPGGVHAAKERHHGEVRVFKGDQTLNEAGSLHVSSFCVRVHFTNPSCVFVQATAYTTLTCHSLHTRRQVMDEQAPAE